VGFYSGKGHVDTTRTAFSSENSKSKAIYPISGGNVEINATIKDLKNARVLIPTTCPFELPIWPVQKIDESGRMDLDFYKLY
jgi:hypothetical protein